MKRRNKMNDNKTSNKKSELYVVVESGDAPVRVLEFLAPAVHRALQAEYDIAGYRAVQLVVRATDQEQAIAFKRAKVSNRTKNLLCLPTCML
jgi:hypothetical protein